MQSGRTCRRVLVVDDESIIADSLVMILQRSGMEAAAAYSGEAAVEMVMGFAPDAVICDVILRGMTGIETAIEIGRMLPACRVILFSGQAATADLVRTSHAAGHDFEILAKPVHPKKLLDLLAKAS